MFSFIFTKSILFRRTNVRSENFEFSRNEEILNEQNKVITSNEKRSIFVEEKLMSRLKSVNDLLILQIISFN